MEIRNKQALTSQPRQRQSLAQTNNLEKMLNKYPLLSVSSEKCFSLKEAVMTKDYQLNVIDIKVKENVTLQWIKVQLIDVLTFCGAFGAISEGQVLLIARLIRNKYYYLTPTELLYFFQLFIGGAYGILYVGKTVNPQIILQGIAKFEENVINMRVDIVNEERERQIEIEKKLIEEGKTGIQAWRIYCQKNNIEGQPEPMDKFIKNSKKKRFNEKNINNEIFFKNNDAPKL